MQCAAPSCSAASTSTCSACAITRYCGRACQVEHRAAHREFCKYVVRMKEQMRQEHPTTPAKFGVMLSSTTYDNMMTALRAGEEFVITDRQGVSERCMMQKETPTGADATTERPYEKSTSRRISKQSQLDDPATKVDIRSVYAHLILHYPTPIQRHGKYFIYAAQVTSPAKNLDHERLALIYDPDRDSLSVRNVLLSGAHASFLFSNEMIVLDRAVFEACAPSAPFTLGEYQFS